MAIKTIQRLCGLLLLASFVAFPFIKVEKPGKKNWKSVVKQSGYNDCGVACLKMIANFYNIQDSIPIIKLDEQIKTKKQGASLAEMIDCAKALNLKADGWKLTAHDLLSCNLPIIYIINDAHYVVIDSISNDFFYIRDSLEGKQKIPKEKMLKKSSHICILFEK